MTRDNEYMSLRLNRFVVLMSAAVLLQICQTVISGVGVQAATPPAMATMDMMPVSGDSIGIPLTRPEGVNTQKAASGEDKPTGKSVATPGDLPMPDPKVGMKILPPVVNLVPVVSKFEGLFAMPEWTLAEEKTFEATAYALRGRTRTGVYVRRGVIAADPSVLPLGSVVQLTAGKYSGVYTVHDTGGKIRGELIDVWMPSNKEARQFGRQNVRVQVLKMGKTRPRK